MAAPTIRKIELTEFEYALPDMGEEGTIGIPMYRKGETLTLRNRVLRVFADDGTAGEYAGGTAADHVALAACARVALGKSAFAREQIYNDAKQAMRQHARLGMSQLDMALWDLAGKILGLPVYQLLGAQRTAMPAYASTYIGDREPDGLSSPEAYADFAEQCRELGYRAYKIHPWQDATVEEHMHGRVEHQPVRYDVRSAVRVPLHVRGLDAEVARAQSGTESRGRAPILVGSQHLSSELRVAASCHLGSGGVLVECRRALHRPGAVEAGRRAQLVVQGLREVVLEQGLDDLVEQPRVGIERAGDVVRQCAARASQTPHAREPTPLPAEFLGPMDGPKAVTLEVPVRQLRLMSRAHRRGVLRQERPEPLLDFREGNLPVALQPPAQHHEQEERFVGRPSLAGAPDTKRLHGLHDASAVVHGGAYSSGSSNG